MGIRHASEQSPLYIRAKNAILAMIAANTPSEDRLPSEEALCAELGVSRPTVREALMALSREGIVSKRHGAGNLIHRSTLNARMRFDKYADFQALLEANGFAVTVRRSSFRHPGEAERAILALAGGSEGCTLFQENLYLADGMPAILAYNFTFFPLRDTGSRAAKPLPDKPFATMITECSGEELAHAIIQLKPDTARGAVAELFGLALGTPLIKWKECHHSVHDTLMAESVIYFNPLLPDLTALRKW